MYSGHGHEDEPDSTSNIYDVPRSHSIQTMLLQYIDEEYSVLADRIQVGSAFHSMAIFFILLLINRLTKDFKLLI